MQLRTLCDSVLYAYLSKVADNVEKQHYLDLSCTVVSGEANGQAFSWGSRDLDTFLNNLPKFEVLDLHLAVFQPYDLRVLLATIGHLRSLWNYFNNFRSDPERSKQFYSEGGLRPAFVATRYLRFLRMSSNSR